MIFYSTDVLGVGILIHRWLVLWVWFPVEAMLFLLILKPLDVNFVQKNTLINIHNRTARPWRGITSTIVVVIWPGWADYIKIESDVKFSRFTSFNLQISREIIASISTRGHCEQPSWVIITENKLIWLRSYPFLNTGFKVAGIVKNKLSLYLALWEFSPSQKELLLVSSRSISSLFLGGDSSYSWVLVHALDLLWRRGAPGCKASRGWRGSSQQTPVSPQHKTALP